MRCPLIKYQECSKKECAWWCAGEKECAIKVIALELIRKGDGE